MENRTLRKKVLLGLGIGISFALCAQTSSCDQATTTDIQNAVTIGCPILSALSASGVKLNTTQKTAATALAQICPPNPPPTTIAGAAADLLNAIAILQPLVH